MNNKRIITIGCIFLLAWLGIVAKIFVLQVVKREYYTQLAQKQSLRRKIISPQRGEVFDNMGNKLIMNANLDVTYAEGKTKHQRHLRRVCPFGSLAGQVLGNIGRDGFGQLGLEYEQDKILRGADGWRYSRYDVGRKYYPGFQEEKKEPVNGVNLGTTIDVDIQQITERALEKGVIRVRARKGIAIIIDPHSGDILAMANYPFYNPNRRTKNDIMGCRNQAISKVYEPGSTFKIITAASVLEEGLVNPEDVFYAENGQYKISGALVRDTKPKENITFRDAMAYSSNVVMVKACMKLKPNVYYQYLRSFGFGMKTGIELPAEESGYLQNVSKWSRRSQATMAWGQEIGTTPLQIIMAGAVIANGGILMKPRLIKEWLDSENKVVEQFKPQKVRRVISSNTASKVRNMMMAVVDYGTASNIKSLKYTLAGKTGTVEKIDPVTGQYMQGKFHSSFIGMTPAESPRFVGLILVDEPENDKYGGSSAAPILKEILDRMAAMPKYNLNESILVQKSEPDEGSLFRGMQAASAELGRVGGGALKRMKYMAGGTNGGNNETLAASNKSNIEIADNWVMPDLENLSLRDALLKLRDMEVNVAYKGVGKVNEQHPAKGKMLERGTRVALNLERNR